MRDASGTRQVAQTIVNRTDDPASPPTPPTTPAAALACTGAGTADPANNLVTSNVHDTRGNVVATTTPSPTGTGTVTTQDAFDTAGRLCRVVENTTGGTNLQTLASPCATTTQGAATGALGYAFDADGPARPAAWRGLDDGLGFVAVYQESASWDLVASTTPADWLGIVLSGAGEPAGFGVWLANRDDMTLLGGAHEAARRYSWLFNITVCDDSLLTP